MAGPIRTLAALCPDWPATAAGLPADGLGAVVFANRVVAATPAAYDSGVDLGQRRREAQSRCPGVRVVEQDRALEARAFEPIVQALESLTPRIEIREPGQCVFPTRGPSRYFGGDEALAAQARAILVEASPWKTGQVAIADGPFAAIRAARRAGGPPPASAVASAVVPAGETPAFLAPLPVGVLDRPDLCDLLVRLGLPTLGAFAQLEAADVLARFGPDGAEAHRLASGLDAQPPDVREVPPDLTVRLELDPPATRVDEAAFAAKRMADELQSRLAARGLACRQVVIEAETEHAERHSRIWRTEGIMSAGIIAERLRWQLDGWLSSSTGPSGGIEFLTLRPDEVGAARGRQMGFWGESDAEAVDARRALARVQRILGPDAVMVPELRGGRGPQDQDGRVPLDAVDLAERSSAEAPGRAEAPWPGQIPAPSPAIVWPSAVPVEVVDRAGTPVGVTGRGLATDGPAKIQVAGQGWTDVVAWAGPWPADERWWDPGSARRRARMQVVVAGGAAYLLVLEGGQWGAEALYD